MKLLLFSLLSICADVVVVAAAALLVEGGLSSELVLSAALLNPLCPSWLSEVSNVSFRLKIGSLVS